MFVLRRQMPPNADLIKAAHRWPWITGWYIAVTGVNRNHMLWTGKISDAKLFATSLQASSFRDKREARTIRTCIVQMITEKELFEAKLKDR